jgi:hypothetical protein
MPTFTPVVSALSSTGLIDSANCFAALSGGIPPRHRPLVMLTLCAPTALAKSSVRRMSFVRSARYCGSGLIKLGSKYGSGGACRQ